MQIPIMIENTKIDTKELTYKVIFNKYMKTSHRILCVCLYACIRGGEIVDYWFPAKIAPVDESAVMETVSLPVWQVAGAGAGGATEGAEGAVGAGAVN
jgi:hypothetical protein